MGKSIPSSPRLQEFARILTSDRIRQHSKRGVKPVSNKTRIVPPPEPAKPKGIRVVQPEQQQRVKIMAENSSLNRRAPLAEVVLECSRRWFQDTLKEAKAGDTGMQVLVGQMYCSGYGVIKDEQKTRPSRVYNLTTTQYMKNIKELHITRICSVYDVSICGWHLGYWNLIGDELGSIGLPRVEVRYGELVINTQVTMLVTRIRMK